PRHSSSDQHFPHPDFLRFGWVPVVRIDRPRAGPGAPPILLSASRGRAGGRGRSFVESPPETLLPPATAGPRKSARHPVELWFPQRPHDGIDPFLWSARTRADLLDPKLAATIPRRIRRRPRDHVDRLEPNLSRRPL